MPARSRKVSSMTARTEYQAAIDARLVFWVTDPGHGWLAVPFKALRDSGVAEQVSSYSYVGSARRGYVGYALLEEDCDAALVVLAFRHLFEPAKVERAKQSVERNFGQK